MELRSALLILKFAFGVSVQLIRMKFGKMPTKATPQQAGG